MFSSLQVSITSQELPNTAETSPRASEYDRDLPGKVVESKGGTSQLLLENSHQLLHAE